MTDSPDPDRVSSADNAASAGSRKCPICKGPVADDSQAFPFCSKRCRTIDLGKWIKGDYVVSRPIEEEDLDQDD